MGYDVITSVHCLTRMKFRRSCDVILSVQPAFDYFFWSAQPKSANYEKGSRLGTRLKSTFLSQIVIPSTFQTEIVPLAEYFLGLYLVGSQGADEAIIEGRF